MGSCQAVDSVSLINSLSNKKKNTYKTCWDNRIELKLLSRSIFISPQRWQLMKYLTSCCARTCVCGSWTLGTDTFQSLLSPLALIFVQERRKELSGASPDLTGRNSSCFRERSAKGRETQGRRNPSSSITGKGHGHQTLIHGRFGA